MMGKQEKTTEYLGIRISKTTLDQLKTQADNEGISVSKLTRSIVEEWLAKQEKATKLNNRELLEEILATVYGTAAMEFFYLNARGKIDLDDIEKTETNLSKRAGVAAFGQISTSKMFESALAMGKLMLETNGEMNSAMAALPQDYGFDSKLWGTEPYVWINNLQKSGQARRKVREDVERKKQ